MKGRFVHTCGSCWATHPRPGACCGQATTASFVEPGPPPAGFGQGPRAPLKPNRARRAQAFARDYGPQSRLCRRLRCSVPSCLETWKIEPDHYLTRGSREGHDEHTWPLCWKHHSERHAIPLAEFEAKYGISAVEVAARLAARIAAHGTVNEPCSDFLELETDAQADKRARRKGAIQRMRCAVCLALVPDPTAELCP
jgi:hypothetical protein